MKEIPLTRGMVALVDDENYAGLARWKWRCMVSGRTHYAVRSKTLPIGGQSAILMHRVILNTPLMYETDHKNGNGLDNRKENLRVATRVQNNRNVGLRSNNTSGFKGVCWNKHREKWRSDIRVNNKRIFLGHFKDKGRAARAYNEAAIKYYGEFARLN